MSRFHTPRRGVAVLAGLATTATTAVLLMPAAADAARRDADRDGMPDRWEARHGLSVTKKNARGDKDRDGLRNLAEYRRGSDPSDEDSDNDGMDDGDEVKDGRSGTRLLDRDSDDDGTSDEDDDDSSDDSCSSDHDLYGTIASFDPATGTLVIDTVLGAQATHVVTLDTEIEFEDHGSDGQGDDDSQQDEYGTTADLVPGALVEEVELNLDGSLEEIELLRS